MTLEQMAEESASRLLDYFPVSIRISPEQRAEFVGFIRGGMEAATQAQRAELAETTRARDSWHAQFLAMADQMLALSEQLEAQRDQLEQAQTAARYLDSALAEKVAMLDAVHFVSISQDMGDFAESFPIVRAVMDMRLRAEKAEAELAALRSSCAPTSS